MIEKCQQQESREGNKKHRRQDAYNSTIKQMNKILKGEFEQKEQPMERKERTIK